MWSAKIAARHRSWELRGLESDCVGLIRELATVDPRAKAMVDKLDAAKKRLKEANQLVDKVVKGETYVTQKT
jgi:hypothetical protein